MRAEDPSEIAGYRLLRRIGEGGMGSVYLSRTRGGQPIALKVIRGEYAQDEEFRRRFQQEVQSARRVQGYHVVPVLDHDATGTTPWLACRYVPGIALDEVLRRFGALPLPAVLQLIGCVAEALRAVHAAGIIHRDLKPSNILLGADGPWVIDFGIARAGDATQLTAAGGLIGTPQYMSPEHALGDPLTPASDMFAVGLIAAVAATGRHPYGDSGALTLATRIANTAQRPPDLSDHPAELRPLLDRCLGPDPAGRATPEELAALCGQSAGRPLREFDGWLPPPIAAEIARREADVAAALKDTTDTGAPMAGTPAPGTAHPPTVGVAHRAYQPPSGTGAPGYDGGAPGYQPTGGAGQPGYQPTAGAPGYQATAGTPGYPPAGGAGQPGYQPTVGAGAPGYPSAAGAGQPGYQPTVSASHPSFAPTVTAGPPPAGRPPVAAAAPARRKGLPIAIGAAVALALVAGAVYAAANHSDTPTTTAGQPPVGATGGTSPAVSAHPSATPPAARVRFGPGPVTIPSEGQPYLDLDAAAPVPSVSRGDAMVGYTTAAPELMTSSGAGLVRLAQSVPDPSAEQCAAALREGATYSSGPLAAGDRFCLVTRAQRLAYLKVSSAPKAHIAPVEFEVTVWESATS